MLFSITCFIAGEDGGKGRGILWKKLNGRELWKDISLLLLGSLIYGIGTYVFVVPANIAPGGATGVALMVNYVTGLPVGILTLLLNVPLLALAWFYLSKKFAISTAVTTTLCSLVLDFVVPFIVPAYSGDRLLCSLYGGVIVGAGMASSL